MTKKIKILKENATWLEAIDAYKEGKLVRANGSPYWCYIENNVSFDMDSECENISSGIYAVNLLIQSTFVYHIAEFELTPKDCPFCGCETVMDMNTGIWVECTNCILSGPIADNAAKAIKAWNRITVEEDDD